MSSSNRSSALLLLARLYRAALWLVPLTGAATYLFARTRMNPLITAAVLWHAAAGTALGLVFLLALLRARRESRLFATAAAISLATGVAMIVAAAGGISIGRLPWIFLAHVGIGFAILTGLLLSAVMRFRDRRMGSPTATAGLLAASATAVLAASSYPAEDYYRRLIATNPRQAGNPLFPAGTVRLQDEAWRSAPSAESCGEAGCHPQIVRQWSASRHAHAAKSLETLPAVTADAQRWCAGCHATSVLLNPKSKIQNPKSVDCLSCHAMAHVPQTAGNGFAVYTPPADYTFGYGGGPGERGLYGLLLRLRPEPHVATLGALTRNQDANLGCAPCHRMGVKAAQNHYKFLRYDNTWAEWQSGPFSQESLRTFQPAARRRDCIDCHMPRGPSGQVDHGPTPPPSNPGPNRNVRMEIFALRRQQVGSGGSERVDAPLENRPITVLPGEQVTVDVVIENHGIGHAFPAATENGENVWLAFEVRDEAGRILSADEKMHRYGQRALDRDGVELTAAQKDRTVTTAYRRFIGPGEADVARYRLAVPPATRGRTLLLRARLMRRTNGAAPPTILVEHSVSVGVRSGLGAAPPTATRIDEPRDAPRLYTYGVALLLQGDNGRARRAFLQAARLAPTEPIYLIGAARASLAEHDLLSAGSNLEAALRLRPNMPQALTWLGTVYRESGQYRKALEVLQPLAGRYPRDRQLWMEIGFSRSRGGDNRGAAEAFETALAIDPDDAAAHYNLMQSYLRERKVSLARREEAIFRALQEDEPLRPILDPYYAAHPDARKESLPIHEHVLRPVEERKQ